MKKLLTIITKHSSKRLSANPENGSFEHRPRLILHQQNKRKEEMMKLWRMKKRIISEPSPSDLKLLLLQQLLAKHTM